MTRSHNPAEPYATPYVRRVIGLADVALKLSYTPKETAVILGIGWRTVYTMLRDGRISPAPPATRPVRIHVSTIAAIIG